MATDDPRREYERLAERIHIVEGLLDMLERDDLHGRLRECEDPDDGRALLMWPDFGFSEIQAPHVLDAPNRRFVGTHRAALEEELGQLRGAAAALEIDPD